MLNRRWKTKSIKLKVRDVIFCISLFCASLDQSAMSADVAAAGSPPPRAAADVGKGTKPDGGVKAAAVRAG